MPYDPESATREFHAAYGITPIDIAGDRAGAVGQVIRQATVVSSHTEQLVGALWSLIGDLEAAASDDVVGMDLEAASHSVAGMVSALYELDEVLGLGGGVQAAMARAHRRRMGASVSSPVASGLKVIPVC
jgi:hypothetical protein